jgi:hypothetical protein
MQLTSALHRNAVLLFSGFLGFVIWGFWKTYYSNPAQFPDLLRHLHGAGMTLWCALLVTQAWLVRTGRRSLHRAIGKSSYLLVPLNVILQIVVQRDRLPFRTDFLSAGVLQPRGITQIALGLGGALLFALIYGLAMLNRRTSAVHGRYMICTILPILSPATDRIVGQHIPALTRWLPVVSGRHFAPFVAWAIGDLLVVTLAIWDWRSGRRNVFPLVLALLIAYQVFTLGASHMPAWRAFCYWFQGIPAV